MHALNTAQKWSFAIKVSLVDLTKPAVSFGFVHIYWRNT